MSRVWRAGRRARSRVTQCRVGCCKLWWCGPKALVTSRVVLTTLSSLEVVISDSPALTITRRKLQSTLFLSRVLVYRDTEDFLRAALCRRFPLNNITSKGPLHNTLGDTSTSYLSRYKCKR